MATIEQIYAALQNDCDLRKDLIGFVQTDDILAHRGYGRYALLTAREAELELARDMLQYEAERHNPHITNPHFIDVLTLYLSRYEQRMQMVRRHKQRAAERRTTNSSMKTAIATAAVSLCAIVGSCTMDKSEMQKSLRNAGLLVGGIAAAAAGGLYLKQKYLR